MKEIERKFLVCGSYADSVKSVIKITQGYICTNPAKSVRVRIAGEKGYITIKGSSSADNTTRFEWEKEISQKDANELLKLCDGHLIEKTRHIAEYKGKIFEVDCFHGANEGLLIAEIELSHAQEEFEKPEWLGDEITSDYRYFNLYLHSHPYKTWKHD